MDTARLTLSALWLLALSSFAPVTKADDLKRPAELDRLVTATASKIPIPQPVAQPSPAASDTHGLVRLYQVRSEVQLTDSRVAHSDSAAFLIRLSVDGDFVVLHDSHADLRYKITGRRFIYQSEEGQETMEASAPAIVAARLEQGRVEILTVTPKRLTILRSLHAEEGYRLTTAQFIGEKPLAGNDGSPPLDTKDSIPNHP
jgi:hypothetical protein